MEALFLLAEKITGTIKRLFLIDREWIGIFNFNEATLTNSSFEIHFSSSDCSILISLNTHYLETPWSVKVYINRNAKKYCLNNLMNELTKDEVVYEVYPNLLGNPDKLGLELAEEIRIDILEFLKSNPS